MSTIRNENKHRKAVLERDKGICKSCGVDTVRLWEWIQTLPMIGNTSAAWRYGREDEHTKLAFRRVLGRHRFRAAVILGRLWGIRIHHHRKSLFEIDHIVPVADGGGECGIENLQTMCLRCHSQKTAEQAGRRARLPSKGMGRF